MVTHSAWPADIPTPETEQFWNPSDFCPRTKIRTKSRGLQPFKLWDHQQILAASVLACYTTGQWLAHVKPRQEGASTFFSVVATQHACFRHGCRVGILAHKKKTAKSLASIVNRAWLSLGPRIRPPRVSPAPSMARSPWPSVTRESRTPTRAARSMPSCGRWIS